MAFRVEWKKSTRKDLRKLPASVVERIVEAVEGLAFDFSIAGAGELRLESGQRPAANQSYVFRR